VEGQKPLRVPLRTGSLPDAAAVKDELMALVEAAGRPETNKLYRTVCRWWTEIEVLIATGATTGKVEANNTGIKHIKRTARIPEPRQLQISYSHDQCRRDSGMTLIRESLPHEPRSFPNACQALFWLWTSVSLGARHCSIRANGIQGHPPRNAEDSSDTLRHILGADKKLDTIEYFPGTRCEPAPNWA
jgi:hypothetical protein